MALEKVVETDLIEVTGDYTIQVRQAIKVMDDEEQIAVNHKKHVIQPDSDWSGEDAKVKKVADALFTDEVKAAWAEKKAAWAER